MKNIKQIHLKSPYPLSPAPPKKNKEGKKEEKPKESVNYILGTNPGQRGSHSNTPPKK